MIKSRKDLRNCLQIEKCGYKLPAFWWLISLFGVSEVSLIWKYQKNLRKWEYHFNKKHSLFGLFYRLKTTRLGYKYGFSISPNCFDVGLKIPHLGSVLVNSAARIGKNCMIHINTAIVATGGSDAAPTIGDNCRIGVGSIIVGGVVIGNNVSIGAGSVVTKNFNEDGVTIAGVPARILPSNHTV